MVNTIPAGFNRFDYLWAALLVGVCAIYFFYALSAGVGVCAVKEAPTTAQEKLVDFLNGIIELGMTLTTALMGLSAALLLGVQGELRITAGVLRLMILSNVLIAQSLLYGVLWKFRVANLWFNGCWDGVASPGLQRAYSGHFYALGLGFVAFAVLVVYIAILRMGDKKTASVVKQ
ncbi:hypothetical protein GOC19_29110 [Sinorhizobium meliloti]|nr:hypothetical protein [Sinorhizobium meliloti]